MAKKRKSRRFNLRRVRIAASLACGALATVDVATPAPIHAVAADKFRVISLNCSYNWLDIADAIDDGAQFGVSHSDYTDAEVEECLEASGSIDLGDKIAQEKANRLVRQIGNFGSLSGSNLGGRMFNDGKPVRTKLNWLMSASDTVNLWVRNSSGVVWTTGSKIGITGDMWVKQ